MTFIVRNRIIFWDISKWNRGQKKGDEGSIYIYIYKERGRERERGVSKWKGSFFFFGGTFLVVKFAKLLSKLALWSSETRVQWWNSSL